jgi:hypothetical protein
MHVEGRPEHLGDPAGIDAVEGELLGTDATSSNLCPLQHAL